MASLLQSCRSLVRRPGFASMAILTLAFGVAIDTALFSIVDGVLLRPLPFPDAGQLVTVYEASPARRERVSLIAPARLEDWKRLNRTFDAISGSYSENVTDTSGAEPERLEGRRVMPRFFDVYGMKPLAGRTFVVDEERFGGAKAVVIGERLWTRRFARRPDAIGSRLTIGGAGYTIVGVMPAAFTSNGLDVWVPAQFAPGMMQNRDARFVSGVGRMKAGTTIAQARADLDRVQHVLGEQFPRTDKDWSASVDDLKNARVGAWRRSLWLIFGAVVLLLLIAIANLAGVMLVQLHRRSVELAVRSAIGGSRAQIVGAVMREVAVVTLAGAALGAAGATWLIRLTASAFADLPRVAELTFNGHALVFTVGVSLAAAAVFGLVPALQVTGRRSLALDATSGGRGAAGGGHRLQRALVVAQIALSLVLTGSAGLLVRSYVQLSRSDTGFNADRTITFHVGAAWDEDRSRIGRLQEELVAALQHLPGVEAAGFTNFLPATGATLRSQIRMDGVSGTDPSGSPTVGERIVTPGYLQALQVPLVAGAWCPDVRFDVQAPGTALVNRRFVDRYAPGQNVVGRAFRFDSGRRPVEVVGIVGDLIEDGPGVQVAPYVYVCMSAGAWPDPEYVVRTAGDPRFVLAQVREIVRRIDPDRPIFGVATVDEVLDEAFDAPRVNARLLSLFAGAALLLASVGLYGLLMLLVTERRRELGVRIALGASPAAVMRFVIAGAGRLLAAGLVTGLAVTLLAGQALRSVLFGVTPLDARALAGAAAVLILVSAVAVLVPARRAARVSAMEAIRGS